MNSFYTICIILLLSAISAFGQDEVRAKDMEQKADEFFQAGLTDSALYYYDLAGRIHRSKTEYTAAFDLFFKAMQIRDTMPGSDLALSYLLLGSVEGSRDEHDRAMEYFQKAYEDALVRNDSMRIAQSLANQGSEFREQQKLDTAIYVLVEAERLGRITGMPITWFAHVNNNIANCYLDKGLIDEAIAYFKVTYDIWEKVGSDFDKSLILNNLGYANRLRGQYDSAILYYYQAVNYAKRAGSTERYLDAVQNLIPLHKILGQKDSAIHYLELSLTLQDQIYNDLKDAEIEELQMQYDYEKVERENAQQRTQIERASNQRRLLLILLLSIILIALVVYLLFKRRVNRREKEFSRINDLLKNQEIKSYQVVLDAQEEERKRIAGELHDRLGSTLSAAKLYFNNMEDLKNGQEAKALKKGVELLDQAVTDVRSISHNMASGILAQFGLEHALIDLRETISGSGRVKMKVITHGLEKLLPRDVQLHIYRIIQELVSNALKHSGATEIIAQVTRHDDEITVTVEDNGSGFKERSHHVGLGLKNLERRVEILNGTYHIDTGKDIGTIVSIDIPIEYDKTYTGG